MFKGVKARKNARLMFLKTKRQHETKHDAFSGYKQKSNGCLVYLEVKLHQDRSALCIYNLKTAKWKN